MIGFLLCVVSGFSFFTTGVILEVLQYPNAMWLAYIGTFVTTIGFCGISDIYKNMKKRIEKLERERSKNA